MLRVILRRHFCSNTRRVVALRPSKFLPK